MRDVGQPNQYGSGLDQTSNPPSARVEHDQALARIHDEIHDQQRPHRFHGLNLGIIKIGVSSEGSLDLGVNIGIAKAEVKAGLENSVHAGVGLGPIVGAEGGVGVGINKHGLHAGVGAGAHALGLAGAGGEVGAKFGDAVGADGVAGVYVGPEQARAGGRGGAGAALGQQGFDAAAGADVYAGQFAGLNAGGQLSLNRDSQVGVDAGGNIGPYAGRTGLGLFSDGNTNIRADVYGDGANGARTTYGDINPPQPLYDAAPAPPPAAETFPVPAPGKITVTDLPPVAHEVKHPTHAQVDAEYKRALKEECDKSTYVVKKGDTWLSIAKKFVPEGADKYDVYAEAAKLQDLHERNGYHSLRPGQRLATEDAYTVNNAAVQRAADYSASDLSK